MLTLALSAYFAAMLMVAGFTKLNDPAYFAVTLRATRLLPAQSISLASKAISFVEILLAAILISGVFPTIGATINLALFAGFLVFKLFVIYRNLPAGCGCFGYAYQTKIDSVDIAVSAILAALAAVYLWLVIWTEPVNVAVHVAAFTLFLAVGCAMLWRILQRRNPKMSFKPQ